MPTTSVPLKERYALSPGEAADYLGCSRQHIYNLLAAGKLPTQRSAEADASRVKLWRRWSMEVTRMRPPDSRRHPRSDEDVVADGWAARVLRGRQHDAARITAVRQRYLSELGSPNDEQRIALVAFDVKRARETQDQLRSLRDQARRVADDLEILATILST